jgi:hypothetical protein
MRPTPESELEQTLDRELRGLPDRIAPETLIPRVLACLAQRERAPWWRKSFAYWPWPARMLFLVTSSGLAALLLYFTWGLSTGATFGALSSEVRDLAADFELSRDLAVALGGAAVTLVKTASPSLLWVAAGVVGACYVTTLTLGTCIYRLVTQRI